jgi:integrase
MTEGRRRGRRPPSIRVRHVTGKGGKNATVVARPTLALADRPLKTGERVMKGSTLKRCDCRDLATGRQYLVSAPKDGKPDRRCPQRRRKGHGSWVARYDAPRGADQKRHQVTLPGRFATQAEAEVALAEALTGSHQGVPIADRQATVGEYITSWLAGRTAIRASTAASYERHLDIYVKPGIGHIRLGDLRSTDLEQLYAAMRQIGPTLPAKPTPMLQRIVEARHDRVRSRRRPSEATIRRVHATISAALGRAVKSQRLARNVATFVEFGDVSAPKAVVWTEAAIREWKRTGKRHKVAVWTPELTGAFLDFAANDDLAVLWRLIALRGLRRGEALGLGWPDVDLDRGTITVRRALVTINHKVSWTEPKTKHGARVVHLDQSTVAALRAHRAGQVHRVLRSGNDLVFADVEGQPLNPDGVSQRFERLVARYGLPPVRLHDLRHGAATIGLSAGISMKTISELLGHSTVSFTADRYTSVTDEVGFAAAESLAAIVPRAVPDAAGSAAVCPPGARLGTNRTPEQTAARASAQVRGGGVAGARTQDRRIMRSFQAIF